MATLTDVFQAQPVLRQRGIDGNMRSGISEVLVKLRGFRARRREVEDLPI